VKPDLSQLRDIHLPGPVSWWPPAPGWWALAALLLLALGAGLWWWRRRQRLRWRRSALGQLARLRGVNDAVLVRELSVLLRRVAVSRYPQSEVAALSGAPWLAFLDRALGGTDTPFQTGAGRVLATGPYAARVQVDETALLALCERWIKQLPTRDGR